MILFARNYESPAQLARLVAEIHALRSPSLLVAVDQEGGRVQRFREGFTRLPPLREIGRRYASDRAAGLALARELGWLMAAELRAVGVDMSFAPCVDLDYGVSTRDRRPRAARGRRRGRRAGGRLHARHARCRHGGDRQALPRAWRGRRGFPRRLAGRPARMAGRRGGLRPVPAPDRERAAVGHGGPRRVPGRGRASGEPLAALGPRRAARRARLPGRRVRGRPVDGGRRGFRRHRRARRARARGRLRRAAGLQRSRRGRCAARRDAGRAGSGQPDAPRATARPRRGVGTARCATRAGRARSPPRAASSIARRSNSRATVRLDFSRRGSTPSDQTSAAAIRAAASAASRRIRRREGPSSR